MRTKLGAVRRIPIKGGSFSGVFPSRFPDLNKPRVRTDLGYESELELDLLWQLDFQIAVTRVETQSLTLEYEWRGSRRTYTPDMMVTLDPDGTGRENVVVVEVKPRAVLRTRRDELAPKFAAARSWCAQQGFTFRVLGEWAIRTPYLVNAKLFRGGLAAGLGAEMSQFLRRQLDGDELSTRDLVERGRGEGIQEPDVREAIERGIASRSVAADLSKRVTDETPLSWRRASDTAHPYDADPFLRQLTGGHRSR